MTSANNDHGVCAVLGEMMQGYTKCGMFVATFVEYNLLRTLEVVHHEVTKRGMFTISSAGSHGSEVVCRVLECLRNDDYVGFRGPIVRDGAAIRPQCGMSQNRQFDRSSSTSGRMGCRTAKRIGVSIANPNFGDQCV